MTHGRLSWCGLDQQDGAALCETCQACPVISVCGGGYLPHRYSSARDFANPSVYCHDLMKLIEGPGLLVFAQSAQVAGKVASRDQRFRMVISQHAALAGEGVLIQASGPIEVT